MASIFEIMMKRPRMYIGDGGCYDLYLITTGYLSASERETGTQKLLDFVANVREFAGVDAIEGFYPKLKTMNANNDITRFIDMLRASGTLEQ